MKSVEKLIEILSLEKKSENCFEGISKDIGNPIVFGGQVLAQAINASHKTIDNNRILHSFHSYFLRPGCLKTPITYEVQNLRDGNSFSTKRVTAIQNDNPIFILACSFHKYENGYDFQSTIKENIKQPEDLFSWNDILIQMGDFLPKNVKEFLEIERPISFKPVQIVNPLEKKDLPPVLDVWFKPKGNTDNLSLATKQEILTYLSDYNLLTTCLNPHASKANFGNTQLASLDHSMWFHREFDFNDWMLFSVEAINTSGARGLANAKIYTREGKLVATLTQEGLMRPNKKSN